jgi:hypothetical protein
MLWPGERLVCDGAGIDFHTHDDPHVVVSSHLKSGAIATQGFIDQVAAAMAPCVLRASFPVLEVSGGLDSACTAVAARSIREDLNSYGLIHKGPAGLQQQRRRQELVDLLGLTDIEHPSDDPSPLAGLLGKNGGATPFDDNHGAACVAGLARHGESSPDLVISGIGGDELCMENTFERREGELPGTACSSVLVATAGRSEMFMRTGAWVVSPLGNPLTVNYARALPKAMRSSRMLSILSLARAGLSDGFLFPRYAEDYGNTMRSEAANFDFDTAMRGSIMSELGVGSPHLILNEARRANSTGYPTKLLVDLYWMLKLEHVLRKYMGR